MSASHQGALETGSIAGEFLAQVVLEAIRRKLLSSEHFTTDGTLIDAWASIKSFGPRDGDGTPKDGEERGRNPSRDYHGERRTNETHVSRTDPDAAVPVTSSWRTAAGSQWTPC